MPISNFFIPKILYKFSSLKIYDEDDIDMMRYSLQAILWETEKIIYLCIIFFMLGRLDIFLVTTIALISIRTSAGGYHSSTSLRCFIISLCLFLIAIFLLPMTFELEIVSITVITVFCFVITFIMAPVISVEKEKIRDKSKNKSGKRIALFMTAIWAGIIYSGVLGKYRDAVIYIILLQNLQLMFEFIRRRVVKKVDN